MLTVLQRSSGGIKKKKKKKSILNLIPFHESGLSVPKTEIVETTFSGREAYSSKQVSFSDLKACLLDSYLFILDWTEFKLNPKNNFRKKEP